MGQAPVKFTFLEIFLGPLKMIVPVSIILSVAVEVKPGFLIDRNVPDSIILRIYYYSDKTDDRNGDYHFQRAQKNFQKSKLDRSLAHINHALDFDPFRKEFILHKGKILEAKQNLQGACNCWKDIIKYWDESFEDLGLNQCQSIIKSSQ